MSEWVLLAAFVVLCGLTILIALVLRAWEAIAWRRWRAEGWTQPQPGEFPSWRLDRERRR